MTVDEYARCMARLRTVVRVGGVPWSVRGRMLEPLAMPHTMKSVDRREVREAMRRTGALVARWTDAWDIECCEYWYTGCDDPQYDVERLPTKHGRRDVRAGLRRCDVRRVEGTWIAEHGYPVYLAAFDRHGSETAPISQERFASGTAVMGETEGFEVWGAFVQEVLVAYLMCLVVDDAVLVWSVKAHPDHRKVLPSDALFYVATRHYLVERGMLYVTGGGRPIHHALTGLESFETKVGWRRIYSPLRVEFRPPAAVAAKLRVGRVGRCLGLGKVAPRLTADLEALSRMAQIARQCRAMRPDDVGVAESGVE